MNEPVLYFGNLCLGQGIILNNFIKLMKKLIKFNYLRNRKQKIQNLWKEK